MQEYFSHVRRVSLYMTAWGGLWTSGAFAAGQTQLVGGLLVGTVASLIYFWLMSYRVRRSAVVPPAKAVGYMRSGWLVRLSFILLVLALCVKIPGLNFPAAVVGLFSLQVAVLLDALVLARQYSRGRSARVMPR